MAEALTKMIGKVSPERLNAAFREGFGRFNVLAEAKKIRKEVQLAHGITKGGDLLSHPEWQHKLGMGLIPSYGLTLHHHRMRSALTPITIDACPSAGDCIRVCVLNNNFGRFEKVQAAWRWRTDLAAHHPEQFFRLLGAEIRSALGDRPHILFRPNINSDVLWEDVCPALVDGSVMGDRVTLYGYTKHAFHLASEGWITPYYHVAYSWNETSSSRPVQAFLERGGNVAVVTDRLAGGGTSKRPVRQWADGTCIGLEAPVVDADTGDEWMLNNYGSIGDLGFKPRTQALRRFGAESDFVAKVYDLSEPLPLEWT